MGEVSLTAGGRACTDLYIEVRDCNSITKANVSLRRGALNIKYGPNGLGKSTISRAIELRAQGEDALDELLPFKYQGQKDSPKPAVDGAEDITSVMVFDDSYVSQFVYQRDEVLQNSFEIFVRTDEYDRGINEIEELFEGLKVTFTENPDLEKAITDFTELKSRFTLTKTGEVSKTSKGYKALAVGGKLQNIPNSLTGYSHFLHGEDPAGWITWQSKGKAFLEISDNCPFCSTPEFDKPTTLKVSQEYESAAVKNMTALRSVIDKLGHYFAPANREKLRELTQLVDEMSPEQGQFLASLHGDVDTLLMKLTSLRALSFHTFRTEKDVKKALEKMKIELSLLTSLESDDTRKLADLLNEQIDEVALRINDINRQVGIQKHRVEKLIKSNEASINGFLNSAGYKYAVRIESLDSSYRMVLEHKDAGGSHIESAAKHLSYGERNAFALILFMYQALRERPDLVVLDDPVSSFDKTKKFAILHRLFRGKESLRDTTTLLLTHDLEPAIDIILTGTSTQFSAASPSVDFLVSKRGEITERKIERKHISTFSQVCDRNILDSTSDVVKCIYLRRRYELHGDRGAEYDVLSSLFHLREQPDRPGMDGERERLDQAEIDEAAEQISSHITGFDYSRILADLRDSARLRDEYASTAVGLEKLQLFRTLSELEPNTLKGDGALQKFINEAFHIENEYVMQLNPREFDSIPEYVVLACDELVGSLVARERVVDV